jgi:hypothetical protein
MGACAGLTLDLTKISNTRIRDIEIIDIRGSGNNTLELNLNDLLAASTSTNILKAASPLITKPPVELFTSAMVLRLMILPLALPNTT